MNQHINRVIFDTNIYGLLIDEPLIDKIEPLLVRDGTLVVYGCSVIRKELRAAPKEVKLVLLELYDHVTKNHDLETSQRAEELAQEYFNEAKSNGCANTFDELKKDLLIVAVAALHNLDVIFSDDAKTMRSESCLNAYQIVNLRRNVRPPAFLSYSVLKKSFIGK